VYIDDPSIITSFLQDPDFVSIEFAFTQPQQAAALVFKLATARVITSLFISAIHSNQILSVTLEDGQGSAGCEYDLLDDGLEYILYPTPISCWGGWLGGEAVSQLNVRMISQSAGSGYLDIESVSF
jgi:hypothetical protein